MIHWKTKEDMGDGFQFNQSEHSEVQYNALVKVEPHEKNVMRTYYLVRDWWDNDKLVKLRDHIDSVIESRKE